MFSNISLTTLHFRSSPHRFTDDINLVARGRRYVAPRFRISRAITVPGASFRQPLLRTYGAKDEEPLEVCEGRVRCNRHRVWPHCCRHFCCDHRRRAGPRLEVEHDVHQRFDRAQISFSSSTLHGRLRSLPEPFCFEGPPFP